MSVKLDFGPRLTVDVCDAYDGRRVSDGMRCGNGEGCFYNAALRVAFGIGESVRCTV